MCSPLWLLVLALALAVADSFLPSCAIRSAAATLKMPAQTTAAASITLARSGRSGRSASVVAKAGQAAPWPFEDDEDDESWRESRDAYSRREFWDAFYTEGEAGELEKGETYDWFIDYRRMRPFLIQFLGGARAGNVLVLGCGSSAVTTKMYDDGWSSITSVDFSEPVIRTMRGLHKDKPGLRWEVVDARDLSAFKDASFDAIVEKGLIDAMLYSDDFQPNVHRVVTEAARVLRPGGVHLSVSIKEPDTMQPLLRCKLWEGGEVRCAGKPTPSTFLYVASRGAANAVIDVRESDDREEGEEEAS